LSPAITNTEPRHYFRVAETPSPYSPSWDKAPVLRTLRFTNDPAASPSANGLRLKNTLQSLVPGDYLAIESGTFSFDSYTTFDPQGTETAPIWIAAAPGARVVITRPDASQNNDNLVLAAAGSAFASQPHQGNPTQLTVVHNTFVNAGTAARLSSVAPPDGAKEDTPCARSIARPVPKP
jgi:hypothetical protein